MSHIDDFGHTNAIALQAGNYARYQEMKNSLYVFRRAISHILTHAAGVISEPSRYEPENVNGHDWMPWKESGKNGTYCRKCEGCAGKVGNRLCEFADKPDVEQPVPGTPGSDPVLVELVRSLQLDLEPFIPVEYSRYVVRSTEQEGLFDVHLFDEDHLFISSLDGVPANGVVDGLRVLAFRYFVFDQGFDHELQRYTFHPRSEEVSDEELYLFMLEASDEELESRTEVRKHFIIGGQ